MKDVTYTDAEEVFNRLGIAPGDTVIIHSSIKAVGWVEGGPQTIASALLHAVGPEGTVVAPTFTFARAKKEDIVTVDPSCDPCDVGAINAALLKTPGARRSTALTHSFAVLGKHQAEICDIPVEVCPLGDHGPFAELMKLDAKVLLLGVAYTHCTAGHFAEYLCHVPYRREYQQTVQVKQPDGSLRKTELSLYGPRTDIPYPPRDFNRAGSLLEKQGLVSIATLGNAYVRLFKIRDFVNLVQQRWSHNDNVLTWGDGQTENTKLKDGIMEEIWFTDIAGNRNHTVRSLVHSDAQ